MAADLLPGNIVNDMIWKKLGEKQGNFRVYVIDFHLSVNPPMNLVSDACVGGQSTRAIRVFKGGKPA